MRFLISNMVQYLNTEFIEAKSKEDALEQYYAGAGQLFTSEYHEQSANEPEVKQIGDDQDPWKEADRGSIDDPQDE